jgi:hypothetical protein
MWSVRGTVGGWGYTTYELGNILAMLGLVSVVDLKCM